MLKLSAWCTGNSVAETEREAACSSQDSVTAQKLSRGDVAGLIATFEQFASKESLSGVVKYLRRARQLMLHGIRSMDETRYRRAS